MHTHTHACTQGPAHLPVMLLSDQASRDPGKGLKRCLVGWLVCFFASDVYLQPPRRREKRVDESRGTRRERGSLRDTPKLEKVPARKDGSGAPWSARGP